MNTRVRVGDVYLSRESSRSGTGTALVAQLQDAAGNVGKLDALVHVGVANGLGSGCCFDAL